MINLNPLGRVAAVVGCRKPPTAASPGACWENRLGKPGDRDHEVVPMVTQADARGPRGNYPGDQHEIYCRHACSDRANGGGEEGRGSNDCGRKNDATRPHRWRRPRVTLCTGAPVIPRTLLTLIRTLPTRLGVIPRTLPTTLIA